MNHDKTIEIKTSCKDCIFAEWSTLTQIGCVFDRLEKYRDMGLTKPIQEDGKQFYEINALCNTCRDKEWADKQDCLISNVKKETAIDVDIIIPYLLLGKEGIDKLDLTLKSIVNMNKKPKNVIVPIKDWNVDYNHIMNLLKTNLKKTNINYYLVSVISPVTDIQAMIDNAFKNVESMYYSVFLPGYKVPNDFIVKINKLINVDLMKFSMIKPVENINGFTVQSMLHKIFYGNENDELSNKIINAAEIQQSQHMVKEWNEI